MVAGRLERILSQFHALGRVYVAEEGINAQVDECFVAAHAFVCRCLGGRLANVVAHLYVVSKSVFRKAGPLSSPFVGALDSRQTKSPPNQTKPNG